MHTPPPGARTDEAESAASSIRKHSLMWISFNPPEDQFIAARANQLLISQTLSSPASVAVASVLHKHTLGAMSVEAIS
jgi:hypothetical protein